jgi:uncharacterized membrane protein
MNSPPVGRSSRFNQSYSTLWVLLVLAGFLRLFKLGAKPFWSDEGVIWYMSLGQIQQDAPRIYQYANQWAIQLFGRNEFAGRLPSALFGILAIPVIYAIGRRMFDARYASIAAGVAAISPYLISLSQEMRNYSLVGLELWLAFWFFLELTRRRNPHLIWWLGFLTVGIIGLYSHCFFSFVLIFLGFAYICRSGWKNWRVWIEYWIVLTIIFLCGIPELGKTFAAAAGRAHIGAADLLHIKMNCYRVARSYFCFLFGDYLTNLPGTLRPYLTSHPLHLISALIMLCIWPAIVLPAAGENLRYLHRRDFQAFAMKTLLGMTVCFTLFYLIIDVNTAAHLVFVYVPFLFIFTRFWRQQERSGWRRGISALFLGLTAISLWSYYSSATHAYERADWRGAGRFLDRNVSAHDAVLLLRARDAYYTLKFYQTSAQGEYYFTPRHVPRAQRDPLLAGWWESGDRHSVMEKVNSLLQQHPRVWIVETSRDFIPVQENGDLRIRTDEFGVDLQIHRVEKASPTDAEAR